MSYSDLEKDKIYIWYDSELFQDNELKDIEERLSKLGVEKNLDKAIGAGASGLNPEVQLLIFISSAIGIGFLQKIGEDLWTKLVKFFSKLSKSRPNTDKLHIPEEVLKNHPIKYDLLLHVHTDKQPYLVMLTLDNESNTERALMALPAYLDEIVQGDSQVTRIYWNGNNWDMV